MPSGTRFLTLSEINSKIMNFKWFAAAIAVSIFVGLTVSPVSAHPQFLPTDECASCGMTVVKYPGPKGLLQSEGERKPFCSARALLCEMKAKGLTAGGIVHDAGKTDWAHPDDEALIAAADAWYVYASQKKAVMGPSLAPFSNKRSAEDFQATNGGTLYRFEGITTDILGCRVHN